MLFFDPFSQPHENDATAQVPESEEVEVFPLTNIPVECDERIHDGVNPCGDPTCYCALYGYGVPSLNETGD